MASLAGAADREAAGRAAWEQVRKDTEAWGRQLDEFVRGPKGATSLLTVCRTPDVLQKLGAPDLPMAMTRDNLTKIMSDRPDHTLPLGLLKQLPAALADPVMVFESATSSDSFVVLTGLKHEGRSVMAAVHLDTIRQRIRVNDIASAYRRGSEAWYVRQMEEGRLLYQDKAKSLAWARTARLPLPLVRKLPARLSEKRILTEKDVVKPVPPKPEKPLASLRTEPRRASDDTPVTVVEVEPGIVPEFKKARDLASWLKACFAFRKEAVIRSTGKKVRFSNRNLEASVKRGRDAAHNQAYAKLDELVAGAVFDGFEAADARHPNLAGQEVYYSALKIGDQFYSVRLKFDVPSEAEVQTRRERLREKDLEDLRYKDHALQEIEIAPVLYRGLVPEGSSTQATGAHETAPVLSAAKLTDSDKSQPGASAIRAVNLGVLRGSVNPSRLENGTLSAIAPGEFLPKVRRSLRPVKASAVRRVVDPLGRKAARAAQTEVVQNFDELPARLREEYGGKARAVEGVYDPATDNVWLVADNLTSLERAADVWAHEQFVHHGLRGMLGEGERIRLLNRLWLDLGGMGNAGVRQIAERYGVDPRGDAAARRQVMEEYIASMAERKRGDLLSTGEHSLWNRIVRAIREMWANLVQAVSGRKTGMETTDIDRLLADLGRCVMTGMPDKARSERMAGASVHGAGEKAAAVVDVDPSIIPVDWRDTKALLGWLRESCQGLRVTIGSDGQNVVVGRRGLEDSLKRRGDPQRQAYAGLRDLLEQAVFDVEEDADARHQGRVRGQNVYYSAMRFPDGKIFSVKFKLDVPLSGEHVAYKEHKVTEMEIAPVLSPAIPSEDSVRQKTSGAIRTLSLSVLKGAVKPSRPENGMLTSLAGAVDREAAGRAAWEQVRKDTEAWERQLDAVRAGKGGSPRDRLQVGHTPDVLIRLGAKALPMEMTRGNVRKVMDKHGVPLDVLRRLPRQLADPLMVLKSATMADAYVILTEMRRGGENLVAAVHFDVEAGRARINDIASVHDRSTVRDTGEKVPGWVWIKNQIAAGNLRYHDKTRSSRWFRELSGLQLSGVMNRESYRGIKILTEKDVVKPVPPKPEKPLTSLAGAVDWEAAGRAAWEQVRKDTEAWERQLDAVRAGKASPRQVLMVGHTPGVLQKLGAPGLPMTMTQSVLHKIGEGGKHGLPDSLLRSLPAFLAEPVMVFTSGTQADSLVALLETIHDGMPVVAAVHLDVREGGIQINAIASVHGRSGGFGWVAGEIRAGRRVYADKTKIPAWLRGFSEDQGSRRMSGLQLPRAFVLPHDPRGVKILTEKDVVKPVPPKPEKPLASLAGAVDREAEGRAAWEQVRKDAEAWERQIDAVRAGKASPRQVLTVGHTPGVLQKLGAPGLPMTMTQSVLRKIGEGGKHGLPDSLLRSLPAFLAEPVMVFTSGTQADSLVALLETIHDGMPVVAAVHLDVSRGSVNINEIASVYGKTNGGLGWVAGEIRAGRRVYADKTKIPAWLRGFSEDEGSRRMSGLQLPRAFVLPHDPRGVKILTEKDVVKPVPPKPEKPLASLRTEPRRASDDTPVTVVEVEPGIVPEFKKARDLAKWLKEYFADKREETILSTGKKVRFGNGNMEASIKRVREAAHNQAYAGLNELVRRAEYDSFEAKDARHPNLGGQEVYYSALRMGDALYAVKFKMDVPGEAEVAVRREWRREKDIEDLRYKDHALREIEIAPVLYRGVVPNNGVPTQATGAHETAPVLSAANGAESARSQPGASAIRAVNLGVLRGSVNPSRLNNGTLSAIAPGEFLPKVRRSLRPVKASAVRRVVDPLGRKAARAAQTEVVQNFDELPARLREEYGGKARAVEGVYDPATDNVWLVADNLTSLERAADVWAHEQFVHHGLRGMLGEGERIRLLNRLWQSLGGMGNKGVRQIAERYGVDPRGDAAARRQVMEEYIASMAERKRGDLLSTGEHSLWNRIVRAIREMWANLVQAVSGRKTGMETTDIDRLLADLGRCVMTGMPERQRIRVNDIASAYRRGSEAWYARQIEEGRLLYQDKTKSLAWARTNRLPLPQVRKLPARLSEKRILTEKDVVKPVPPKPEKPLASLAGAVDRKAAGRAAWEQVREDTETGAAA